MLNIVQIFQNDVKSIFKNKATIIVILALCLIPCLYTLINVQAIWNPYGKSELINLKIAVVNNDSGVSINNQKINVGKKVVKKLKSNHDIGWTILSKNKAQKGVMEGKYISEIYLPSNFSSDLLAFTKGKPKFSEIKYIKNTNQSPMSGIISDAAATKLQNEININFIDTLVGKILGFSNNLGYKADKNKNKIFTLKNYTVGLSENINLTISSLNRTSDLTGFMSNLVNQSNSSNQLSNVNLNTNDITNNFILSSSIKNSLTEMIYQNNLSNNQLLNQLSIANKDNVNYSQKNFYFINNELENMQEQISLMKQFLLDINTNNNIKINQFIDKLTLLDTSLNIQKTNNQNIFNSIKENSTSNTNLLSNQMYFSNKISKQLVDLLNNSNADLDNISSAESDFKNSFNKFLKSLNELNNSNYNDLTNISNGFSIISQTSLNLGNQLRYYEPIIKKLGNQLNLISNNKIVKIINIANGNPKIMGKAISSPFKVKSENIYPIKNFGSAFAPSYIAISIWVGCAMLVSVLSTDISDELLKLNVFSIIERYFGKLLIFNTLSLLQTLVIINSTMLILKVHIESILLYEIAGLLVSLTFSTIVYSLVSILGNLGKAVSVILVALQIAGSGAIYPIQLEPTAYRLIQPFFPFTYAVGLFRESIGGPSVQAVSLDIFCLLLFLVLIIVLSILLKPHTSQLTKKLQNKFIRAGISDS